MRPTLIALGFGLALAAPAGGAQAQTWGQPVYLNAYGRPLGGTPLSEVETRSYVGTGRWADGRSDQPQVHVPGPGYGRSYARYGSGYRYSDGRRYDAPSRPGYRDEWGYNDDRPPSSWRGRSDRGYRDDRGCGCADVYFYDR